MLNTHAHILPGKDINWYREVQRPFTINQRTGDVYFPRGVADITSGVHVEPSQHR